MPASDEVVTIWGGHRRAAGSPVGFRSVIYPDAKTVFPVLEHGRLCR